MKLQKNYLIDGEIRIIEKQEDSLIKSKKYHIWRRKKHNTICIWRYGEKNRMMSKKPYRRIKQECPECEHPYVHEITITGRYEWYCPRCGLVIWET